MPRSCWKKNSKRQSRRPKKLRTRDGRFGISIWTEAFNRRHRRVRAEKPHALAGLIRTSMNRPLLLGHRGARASRHLPENTLASFELCLEQGCDGFEFDVHCSSDKQGVICHDAE